MQTLKFSTIWFTITALALAAGLAGAPTIPAAMACQVFGLVCLAARD